MTEVDPVSARWAGVAGPELKEHQAMKTGKIPLLLMVLSVSGCLAAAAFDLETTVSLRPDLSCTASVTTSSDAESVMASMPWPLSAAMRRDPQALHEAVLAEVTRLAATSREDRTWWDGQFGKTAPSGIRLTADTADFQGTTMVHHFELDCADARKLWQVVMPQERVFGDHRPVPGSQHPPTTRASGGSSSAPSAQPPAPPPSVSAGPGPNTASPAASTVAEDPRREPYRDFTDRPFYGLEVGDLDNYVMVTLTFANPVPLARAIVGNMPPGAHVGNQPPGASTTVLEKLFAGSRFIFRFDSPFEVVSSNATRQDGHKLYWEIPVADPQAPLQQILIAVLKR
jgi:hypothetical protein